MGKGKPRHKDTSPTKRKRLFTDEFKKGDEVYVIRHEHGWEDGNEQGKIIELDEMCAIVGTYTGFTLIINHPRDIRKSL